MIRLISLRMVLMAIFLGCAGAGIAQTTTFSYTGGVQTYTVPAGVHIIRVDAQGAKGGGNEFSTSSGAGRYCSPGAGGRVQSTMSVTPGQVLYINVGGQGGDGYYSSGTGGYNGGGNGANDTGVDFNGASGEFYYGGGGGGATSIMDSASVPFIVAAGGGGAGLFSTTYGNGGNGGGTAGSDGASCGISGFYGTDNGTGATSSSGGFGGWGSAGGYSIGSGTDGGFGYGGAAAVAGGGGGGGGGYYGGGGGQWGGGGGGSSYADASTSLSTIHTSGYNASGDGVVVITPDTSGGSLFFTVPDQSITICGSTAGNSIDATMTVFDSARTGMISWSVYAAPSHGTVSGTYSTGATGGIVNTSGLTYSPAVSFTGSDAFTIAVTDGSTTAYTTIHVTVPYIDPIVLPGTGRYCYGSATTFSDATSGGIWSVGAIDYIDPATGDASFDPGGYFYGSSYETSYSDAVTYTTPDGCSVSADFNVDLIYLPGTTATEDVCQGDTIILYPGYPGGIGGWRSSDPSIAGVFGTSDYYGDYGNVAGIGAGTATISYIASNGCGTSYNYYAVTVHPTADPGYISGASSLCAGTTAALTESTTGGTWSSSSPSIATVDTTGTVTALATGTATITYSVTNSCGTASTTSDIAINPASDAGHINGLSTLCVGAATTLNDSVSGGVWSSSNPAVIRVDSFGRVTGVAAGTGTISYSVTGVCGASTVTKSITVNALPSSGTITGTGSICTGGGSSSTTLIDTTRGGVWSSSNTVVATVNSSTGYVHAVSGGVATISYSVARSGCSSPATKLVTVSPNPGIITASSTSLCAGSTATLTVSGGSAGGTWSSTATSVATVSSSGVVTGVSSGTASIRYTVTGTCGTAYSSISITSLAFGTVAAISGGSSVCPGVTTTMTDATTGGAWSSSNTSVATVSTAGVVTAIASGFDTIMYTVSTACGAVTTRKTLTVTGPTYPSAIGGPYTSAICPGHTVSLVDATTGGTWSSTNTSIATVSASGVVTGVVGGVDTIKYSITNSCGLVGASKVAVTITPLPNAGTISGPANLCIGGSGAFTSTVTGGVWSSSIPAAASITSVGGVATAAAAGNPGIQYTYTNGCGSASAWANLIVSAPGVMSAITGATSVCPAGGTTTLGDAWPTGSWSSSNLSLASVDAHGLVTGIASGLDTIYFAGTTACGTTTVSKVVTVTGPTVPAAIGGRAAVCAGSTTTLTDATTGGVWNSSNASLATISAAGVVTGVAAGIDTIIYAYTNSCGQVGTAWLPMLVDSVITTPTVTGAANLCGGTTGSYTGRPAGGSWSSTNTSAATVGATSGIVTAITGGVTSLNYAYTNSCGTYSRSFNLVISSPGYIAAITGSSSECIGTPVTFSSTSTGGTWTSGSPSIATVGSTSGAVYGVSAGTAVITYSLTNACGTVSTTRSMTVYAYAPSPGTLGGPTTVAVGSTITITRTGGSSSGVWSSVSASVATVGSGTGVVTGVAVGSDTIKYTVTNACGSNYSSRVVSVTAHRDGPEAVAGDAVNIHVYPNPTTGLVTLEIKGTTGTVNVMISDMSGKTVDFRSSEEATINFDMGQYAPGIYLMKISVGGKVYIEKVVVQ